MSLSRSHGALLNLFDRHLPFDPAKHATINCNPTCGQVGIVGRFSNGGMKIKLQALKSCRGEAARWATVAPYLALWAASRLEGFSWKYSRPNKIF